MKVLFFIFIWLVGLNTLAQDSINAERIYKDWQFIYLDYQKGGDFLTYYDSLTKEPIQGWVQTSINKGILLTHFKDGLQDGFYANYKKYKNTYQLEEAGYRSAGFYIHEIQYDYKKKAKKNQKFGGKKKIVIERRPDYFGDNPELDERKVTYAKDTYKIKDSYFLKDGRSKNEKYEVQELDSLLNFAYSDSIDRLFPSVLNSNLNPFTLIRFDGYYRLFNDTSNRDHQRFIKFLPNGTVLYKLVEEKCLTNQDWTNCEEGNYKLKDYQVECAFKDDEMHFSSIKFVHSILVLKTRYYKQGLNKVESYYFISED